MATAALPVKEVPPPASGDQQQQQDQQAEMSAAAAASAGGRDASASSAGRMPASVSVAAMLPPDSILDLGRRQKKVTADHAEDGDAASSSSSSSDFDHISYGSSENDMADESMEELRARKRSAAAPTATATATIAADGSRDSPSAAAGAAGKKRSAEESNLKSRSETTESPCTMESSQHTRNEEENEDAKLPASQTTTAPPPAGPTAAVVTGGGSWQRKDSQESDEFGATAANQRMALSRQASQESQTSQSQTSQANDEEYDSEGNVLSVGDLTFVMGSEGNLGSGAYATVRLAWRHRDGGARRRRREQQQQQLQRQESDSAHDDGGAAGGGSTLEMAARAAGADYPGSYSSPLPRQSRRRSSYPPLQQVREEVRSSHALGGVNATPSRLSRSGVVAATGHRGGTTSLDTSARRGRRFGGSVPPRARSHSHSHRRRGTGEHTAGDSGDFFDRSGTGSSLDAAGHHHHPHGVPSVVGDFGHRLIRMASSMTPFASRQNSQLSDDMATDHTDDSEDGDELVAVKICSKSFLKKVRTLTRDSNTRKVSVLPHLIKWSEKSR